MRYLNQSYAAFQSSELPLHSINANFYYIEGNNMLVMAFILGPLHT